MEYAGSENKGEINNNTLNNFPVKWLMEKRRNNN